MPCQVKLSKTFEIFTWNSPYNIGYKSVDGWLISFRIEINAHNFVGKIRFIVSLIFFLICRK